MWCQDDAWIADFDKDDANSFIRMAPIAGTEPPEAEGQEMERARGLLATLAKQIYALTSGPPSLADLARGLSELRDTADEAAPFIDESGSR